MRHFRKKYDISGKRELLAAMAENDPRSALIALLSRIQTANFVRSASAVSSLDARPVNGVVVAVPRLILPLSGIYRFILHPEDRERDLMVEPGQFCWVRAGDWTATGTDTERTMLSVSLLPSHLRFLWYYHPGDGSDLIPPKVSLVFHTRRAMGGGLRHSAEAINAAAENGCADVMVAAARAVMAWCLQELRNDPGEVPPAGRELHSRIALYLTEQLAADLNRERVARHFGIGPDYLTRLFHDHARLGFNEFVRRERLGLARRLLHSSRLSVKEIGAACGFNLTAYFIKRFREEFGTTPAAFRRKSKELQQEAPIA